MSEFTVTSHGINHKGKIISTSPIEFDAKFFDIDHVCHARVSVLSPKTNLRYGYFIPFHTIGMKNWYMPLAIKGLDAGPHNSKQLATYLLTKAPDVPLYECVSELGEYGGRFYFYPHQLGDPASRKLVDKAVYYSPEAHAKSDNCFSNSGTFAEAIASINEIASGRPRIGLAIYASFSAIISKIVGAKPFAIQFSGPEGCGAAECVDLAASVWGRDSKLVVGWHLFDSSYHNISDSMPAFIGGISNSKSSKHLVDLLSKSRVAICSGLTDQAGLEGRMIDMWGMPWGAAEPAASEAISKAMTFCREQYGAIGREVVERLNARLAEGLGDKINKAYGSIETANLKMCAEFKAPHVGRILSVLMVSAHVLHALIPELEIDQEAVWKEFRAWLSLTTDVHARATLARDLLNSYIQKHKDQFVGLRPKAQGVPTKPWLGRTDPAGHVWIREDVFFKVMERNDLDPLEIMREWKEAGMLATGQAKPCRTMTLGSSSRRCLALAKKFQ